MKFSFTPIVAKSPSSGLNSNVGQPLSNARGPLVPGIPRTSVPMLVPSRLLGGGVLLRPAEVRVHQERRREDVRAHQREAVRVAVAVARVAAATNRPSHRIVTKHRWYRCFVVQDAEGTGHVELVVHVVVDLR